MLLNFSVQNFKSFVDKTELNLIPSKIKDLNQNIAKKGKYSALKSIAIYGANASGKSSLLEGLFSMVYLVKQSAEFSPNRKIGVYEPFYFDKLLRTKPIKLSLEFILDKIDTGKEHLKNVRFIYTIAYTKKEIVIEELYFYPKGKKSLVFKRKNMNFIFGDYYNGERKSIQKSLFPNQLFLSKARFFNVPLLHAVLEFFDEKIIFPNLIPELTFILNNLFKNKFFRYTIKEFVNSLLPNIFIQTIDNKTFKRVAEIIKAADIGIKDLKIKKKERQNFLEQLMELEKEAISFHISLDQKQNIPFEFERESSGTQWLLALGALLVNTLDKGGIIIIDEFEKNLHPNLVLSFLEIFNSNFGNKRNAQLIFTTHNLEILEANILRFDQIWFTEKDEKGKSELYSLKDIEGVRKENAIKEWYQNGRFGAVPLIDKFSLQKIFEAYE